MRVTQNLLVCVLVAILFVGILFFAGCDKPAKRPCCPGGCPKASSVVVLHFTASWCGPCQRQKPEVARLREAGVRIATMDIDANRDTAAAYGVAAVPTYIVRINGTERARTNDVAELRRLLGR